MLNERQIKDVEERLNAVADVYYSTHNRGIKESNRGYCQGIAYMLSKIGYAVEWDNGKATLVKED